MSFEADLRDLLAADPGVTALVGAAPAERIYPLLAPTDAAKPYVTWQRISSAGADLASRAACEQIGLQVDCWAETFDEACALGRAVSAAIAASTGAVRGGLDSDIDLFDEASRLYRRLLSFTVFHPAN